MTFPSANPGLSSEAAPQFNAFGFCVECGLERMDAERWEDRARRKVISVIDRHARCGHVLFYRTLKREWR